METSESKMARHIIYTRIMSNLCTPQGRRRGLYNGSAECKLNLCRTAKQSEAKIKSTIIRTIQIQTYQVHGLNQKKERPLVQYFESNFTKPIVSDRK